MNMEARQSSNLEQRVYDDFVPEHELLKKEEEETILVNLPGFRKEHLRVRIIRDGRLIITGERPLVGNRWKRFHKEFQVPDYCNTNGISAKFENGILYVKMPKVGKPNGSSASGDITGKKSDKSDAQKKKAEEEEEPKDAGKVTSKGKEQVEDGGKGEADAVAAGEEGGVAPAQAMNRRSGSRLGRLKLKMGRLDYELYKTKQLVVALVVVVAVSLGLGFYLHHRRMSP